MTNSTTYADGQKGFPKTLGKSKRRLCHREVWYENLFARPEKTRPLSDRPWSKVQGLGFRVLVYCTEHGVA